jgi:hypothetical protein
MLSSDFLRPVSPPHPPIHSFTHSPIYSFPHPLIYFACAAFCLDTVLFTVRFLVAASGSIAQLNFPTSFYPQIIFPQSL